VRRAQDGLTGQGQLVERRGAEQPRAVDRNADLGMLFHDEDVVPAGSEIPGGHEPGRSGADDNDIAHV
jgi:hypothetical protein